MIAMLDGLGSYEVEPGNGSNFVGGAAYPGQGFPVWPSSTGLAAVSMEVEPGNGGLFVGGAAYPGQGFPVWPSSTGLAEYDAAFAGTTSYTVEPGDGSNFVGGAAYPGQGFPVWPSSTGLAAASEPGLQFQRAQFLNTEINNMRRLISVCERVARQLAANCPGSSATVSDAFRSAGEASREMGQPNRFGPAGERMRLRRVLSTWRATFANLSWCSRTALVAGTPLGVAVGQLRRALGLSA
jgi:hypothetical protein